MAKNENKKQDNQKSAVNLAKYYKILTVPVTEIIPKVQLEPIIYDFRVKKMTFGLSKEKRGFCIWREPLMNEYPIKKISTGFPVPGEIIVTDQAELDKRYFVKIWDKGREIL